VENGGYSNTSNRKSSTFCITLPLLFVLCAIEFKALIVLFPFPSISLFCFTVLLDSKFPSQLLVESMQSGLSWIGKYEFDWIGAKRRGKGKGRGKGQIPPRPFDY
jgi:hypothetical protein